MYFEHDTKATEQPFLGNEYAPGLALPRVYSQYSKIHVKGDINFTSVTGTWDDLDGQRLQFLIGGVPFYYSGMYAYDDVPTVGNHEYDDSGLMLPYPYRVVASHSTDGIVNDVTYEQPSVIVGFGIGLHDPSYYLFPSGNIGMETTIEGFTQNPSQITVYHIEKALDADFFVNSKGRVWSTPNPADIIQDLIVHELGVDSALINATEKAIAVGNHYQMEYSFSVTERMDSKKLIESISSESKLFARYSSAGDFQFTSIRDYYDIDSYTNDIITFTTYTGESEVTYGNFIDNTDIIKFSIKRTSPQDVITKSVLHYSYDYGRETYKGNTEINTIEQTAKELFPDAYSNMYYNISPTDDPDDLSYIEQGDSPVELKCIQDTATANKLQQYRLGMWCNQHNIFKLRLPLKYLKYEIGDIIAFKELIEGRKAFGEDYSFNKRVLENQKKIRNGQ